MTSHPFKVYRDRESLSQEQMAEKLGISRQMVGLIESGERRITAENAKAWAPITGIPRSALCPEVFGDDPPAITSQQEARVA